MGNETLLFVGGYYEIKNPGAGQQVTKYYFAGASRIAMRKYTIPSSMAVEYLLGDHLGSTSITTNANGAKISEIRYKPCPLHYVSGMLREGEIRYSWTSNPSTTPAYKLTSYTFTGQYSYMDDPTTAGVTEGFGLMFYNARMYDPALGRFIQADSIVPVQSQGVQAWDRFAYTNNNPVRYVDPSGHMCSDPEDPTPSCENGNPYPNNTQPLPPAPVVINNPDPLEPGLEQDEPTPTLSNNINDNNADGLLSWFQNLFNGFNYYVGTDNLLLYLLHTWMYDIQITGQIGVIFSNNSPLTISLIPPGLRHAFYQSNDGFSLNYTTNPSLGYGQSLPHSVISTASGINVNPLTGGVTTNFSIGGDSVLYRQSVTVQATIRPMETLVATITGIVVGTQLIPTRVDDAAAGYAIYRLCQTTGLCP